MELDRLTLIGPRKRVKPRDRLIFVQWAPEVEGYEMQSSSIVAEGFNIPVMNIRAASFTPVFEALSELPRRFPAQLLRKLKEHVYDLVLTNDPNGNIYVQDIDEANGRLQVDVVFGVGVVSRLGYRAITREDLLNDILFDNGRFNSEMIVNQVLPVQLSKTVYVPVFKYLRASNMIDEFGHLCVPDVDPRVQQAVHPAADKFYPPQYYRNRGRRETEGGEVSLADVIENYDLPNALNLIPFLDWDRVPLEELRELLVAQAHLIGAPNSMERIQYYKVVCLYDYLRYRSQ